MAAGWTNMASGDGLSASRTTLNTGFTELSNCHKGASEPTNKVDGMLWLDSANNQLKIYDSGNTAWRVIVNDYTVVQGGIAHLTVANTFTQVQTGVSATGASHFPIASQLAAQKQVAISEFTFANASGNHGILIIPQTGRLAVSEVYVLSDTSTMSSDGSNNWSFQVANLTAGNNLLSVAKTTNGAEITADTAYALGVNQNNAKGDLDALDVLELQITKTGAPTSLASARTLFQIVYTVDLF